jgi:hypothetical protein
MRYAAPHLTLGIADPDTDAVPETDDLVPDPETGEMVHWVPTDEDRAAWHEAQRLAAEPDPASEMVPFSAAGNQMLDAYVARGMDRNQARPCAALMWSSAGLKKGESILRSRLDRILDEIRSSPPANTEPEAASDEPPAAGPPSGVMRQLDDALDRAKTMPGPAAAPAEVVQESPAGAMNGHAEEQPAFEYDADTEPF